MLILSKDGYFVFYVDVGFCLQIEMCLEMGKKHNCYLLYLFIVTKILFIEMQKY